MGSLLLEGGIVVPVDADRTILDPGYVLVEDGTIRAVGGDSPQQKADRVLDVSGCIVVPGFVNTHQHRWYNLFKGLGEGMLLEQWISDLLVPTAQTLTPEDLGVASRLSCLELIRSGTTTSINHMVSSTSEPHVDAILEAVVDMGMRQLFAKEVRAWDRMTSWRRPRACTGDGTGRETAASGSGSPSSRRPTGWRSRCHPPS